MNQTGKNYLTHSAGNWRSRCSFALLAFVLVGISPAPAAASDKTTAGTRTIHFPDQSLGGLLLVRPHTDFDLDGAPRLGIAKGTVTLKVPANRQLMLDLNRNIVQNPALLENLRLNGVERLKVNINGLDQVEHVADRVLQHVSPSICITCLDVHLSDATDDGLKRAAKIVSLTDLNASHCEISGSSLPALAALPGLERLSLSFCPLQSKNLGAFAGFKKLKTVDLQVTDIDDAGIKSLCTCTSIEKLILEGNRKISDKSIPYLLELKHLKSLNLKGTTISISGVSKLSVLNLKDLTLPFKYCTRDDKARLHKLFAGTKLGFAERPQLNEWQKEIFAPLK